MDRRTVLRYTALLTGASVGIPLASTLLTSCMQEVADKESGDDLQFFSAEGFQRLQALIDTILPKSDSPSATDVGVDRIIDTMVGVVYTKEQKESYQKGFDALSAFLKDQSDVESAIQLIEKGDPLVNQTVKKAYLALKQQTIAYYLSTKTIGTEFLNYLPVPGTYEACISLEETGGKAWAI